MRFWKEWFCKEVYGKDLTGGEIVMVNVYLLI